MDKPPPVGRVLERERSERERNMEEEGRSSSSKNGSGLGEKKKKKVMVAIDESECSHYAVEWALQNLVDTLANSDLCIFTVQPIADYSYLYASSFGAARKHSLYS